MENGLVSRAGPVARAAEQPKVERFGRYYLLERIGEGGMAEVYRTVTHGTEGFRRIFVIKRILDDKSRSPEFIRMFCDEARICALLHHPNIVQVYDFGHVNGSYFLAMEYLAGRDLRLAMRALRASKRAVPPSLAAFIAQQVALGLNYAHALRDSSGRPLGIVHRDVTPSNIMLLNAGAVKILDFGIAKVSSTAPPPESQPNGRAPLQGKLAYLSPEQARAEPLDGRSDIFALGVTLWEMLTGKRLFAGSTDLETLRNVLRKPLEPPSTARAEVPAELDRVVLHALARDRELRYGTGEEMANDLDQFLRDARYERRSLQRFLVELFGAESSPLSMEVPEPPLDEAPTLLPDEEAPAPPAQSLSDPSLELDIVSTPAATSVPDGIPRWRRLLTRRRAICAVGAVGVVAVGVALELRACDRGRSTPAPVAAAAVPVRFTPGVVDLPSTAPSFPAQPTTAAISDEAEPRRPSTKAKGRKRPRAHRLADPSMTINPF
jgi:serine/threonine protein kinase